MIYYPKIFATCMGANKAINMAYKLREEYNKTIYIYKEILHNEYIIEELKRNNIITIDNLDNLNKGDILIIRAHGEPKETYNILNKKGITYYDATCIRVSKIHNLVENKYNLNYKIIIVGKKEHPEVIGTNGWCNNEAIIIENKDDYDKLNKNDKYYVVAQTTISTEKFNDLINFLNNNNYNFEYDNTICNNQTLIHSSSLDLAKYLDIMFVIGGKNSSNTKELFNKCSKVCKSYFFSNINDFYEFIIKQKYNDKTKIGFTGGASTSKNEIYEYAHLLEFIIYYKKTKNKIDKEMIKFNKSIKCSNNTIIDEALNKFKNLNSDGKYIRGTLIDLGYKLNKTDDYSLKLSASYEAFETSILIHDDIIDNSDLRRDKKTIHKEYQDLFNKFSIDNTPYSLALCLGDIGFYYIYNYIIKNYKNDKNLLKILEYYNNIVIDTIKGEILDIYLPFVEKNDKKHLLNEDDVLNIYKLKTAKYTIIGPFILGMILSNSKNKDIKKMEEILTPLGIAFQIKDDILGIFSESNIIGKPTSSDIEEFKMTILYSYIKINKPHYLKELLKYYGNKTDNNCIKEVQKILIESGSLEYANNKMNYYFELSKYNLNNLNINSNIKNILIGFIKYLEIRKK